MPSRNEMIDVLVLNATGAYAYALTLRDSQVVVFAQSVGFPKK